MSKRKWKHLYIEKRKSINSMVSHNYKLKEIGRVLHLDPSTISKELKRNRTLKHKGSVRQQCKKLDRFPYVCNNCPFKYKSCKMDKYYYNASMAQNKADERLKNSRRGIDMDKEEFEVLDKLIKEGIDNKQSIYHIVHDNEEIGLSVSTVYRYINKGILKTKRMDLPYAVSYKKRKRYKEKYDYSSSNKLIDRSNRTYLDYMAFKHKHHNLFECQMDFLGSIKSDSKAILTITIPDLHFVKLEIIDKPNAKKIVDIFNKYQDNLGIETFKKIFPYILTDRDPCFSRFVDIETDYISKEKRTNIFYCDPYVSVQKANVENMNKQLRKFFPKNKSIDEVTPEMVKEVNRIINETRVRSLSGYTPKEAFIKIFGEEAYDNLMK